MEPEEENAQPRTLRWVPLVFLGKIGPRHHADSWHLSLWQTFFCSTIGERVLVLVTLPTRSYPGATCGCSKFLLDSHGDHVGTCKSHSGATKSHDWMVAQLGPLFGTTGHKIKTQGITPSSGLKRGDIEIINYSTCRTPPAVAI